eukprot:6490933-Amphidinium_carterae.3
MTRRLTLPSAFCLISRASLDTTPLGKRSMASALDSLVQKPSRVSLSISAAASSCASVMEA